jgi:hypothetical protein
MSIQVRRTINILFVCVLILLTATACGSATPIPPTFPPPTATSINTTGEPSLIGMWKGEYGGSEVIMTFEANGNISIAVYGDLKGGTYSVDYKTKPYQLDLVIKDNGTIQTILEFVDNNTIKIENVYAGDARPTEFKDFFLLSH